ncbi:MAG: hypothetical protein H6R04_1492 [Burkholderiaceae bacterium]|nr:hypothetical protein [Burkholderiaceae bacterium]
MFIDRFRPAIERQRGLTLIELVIFIIIIGVGVAGILSVMTLTTRHSADPMLRKQALAVAESLLEEIELHPFTYCDPDDANAATATVTAVGANGCATTVQGIGPTAGETRYSDTVRFDNVGDYDGFAMNGINNLTNASIGGLEGYNATVAITADPRGGVAAAGDVLRIDVTVTPPGGDAITLTGYRFRYAPRITP